VSGAIQGKRRSLTATHIGTTRHGAVVVDAVVGVEGAGCGALGTGEGDEGSGEPPSSPDSTRAVALGEGRVRFEGAAVRRGATERSGSTLVDALVEAAVGAAGSSPATQARTSSRSVTTVRARAATMRAAWNGSTGPQQ